MNLIANQSKNKQEMIGVEEEKNSPFCGNSASGSQIDRIDH